MLDSLKTTKGRIIIGALTSAVFVVLWFVYELPIAIMPALLVPIWIPVFSRQQEAVSPGTKRFLLASVFVGMLLFAVLFGLYLVQR